MNPVVTFLSHGTTHADRLPEVGMSLTLSSYTFPYGVPSMHAGEWIDYAIRNLPMATFGTTSSPFKTTPTRRSFCPLPRPHAGGCSWRFAVRICHPQCHNTPFMEHDFIFCNVILFYVSIYFLFCGSPWAFYSNTSPDFETYKCIPNHCG